MDEIGDYLSRLRKGLKGISDSEREDIAAEIRSHIEDGLQDPRTGASERQRLERIMSELGNPAEMAKGMNMVYRTRWYIRALMVLAAITLIASVFFPFAAGLISVVPFIFVVVCPYQVWWFGCPLIIIGIGMLTLSIFRLSRRRALIFKIAGSMLFAFAATMMLLSHLKILPLITFAFLPMLISGLIFIFGSIWTVRKGGYSKGNSFT
jgi:hypothetical protein